MVYTPSFSYIHILQNVNKDELIKGKKLYDSLAALPKLGQAFHKILNI